MSEKLWQTSIGNDASLHDPTPAASTVNKPPFASADLLKKVVLLVDSNAQTRESRAKVLRKLGVTVHSVSSASTARTRLANSRFDLILVDLGTQTDDAEALVAEIRLQNRKQRVAFLVGKPLYVSSTLKRKESAAQPAATAIAKPAVVVSPAVPLNETNESALSDFGRKIKQAERAG